MLERMLTKVSYMQFNNTNIRKKIMKAKIVLFTSFAAILFMSSELISQYRGTPELIIRTRNGTSPVTFYTELISSKAWAASWLSQPQNYLTDETKYTNPDDLVMPGEYSNNDKGFNTDIYPYERPPYWPVLGRGDYKITTGVDKNTVQLLVKAYGSTFNYPDKAIWFNYTEKTFEDSLGNPLDEIVLYYGTGGLQPTPPTNFICTNPTNYGQNPQFEWYAPEHPESTTFSYQIYRNTGAGYTQIGSTSSTTYTDTGAELDKFGNTTYYYVKAKGSNSPLSDASNIVEINTDIASKPLPGSSDNKKEDTAQPASKELLSLSIYPNPFNAEAKLSYVLEKDARINIKIYNFRGQQIATLENGFKPAGTHTLLFCGGSLPGGVYFLRMQIKNQQIAKKILLLK